MLVDAAPGMVGDTIDLEAVEARISAQEALAMPIVVLGSASELISEVRLWIHDLALVHPTVALPLL
jgi:hypothetical protein